jgi:hypothetical protein
MNKMKILAGCWDEGTLDLVGMPESFILSARELVVMEVEEYDALVAEHDKLLDACQIALGQSSRFPCPFCDGSGTIQDSEDECRQCQWCDEKNRVRAAIAAAEKVKE